MAGWMCITLLLLLSGIPVWSRKTWRRRGQQLVPNSRERSEAGGESFPLDFTAVEGNMDNFMAQIKSLAQSLYPCSAQRLDEEMKLHLLHNQSVTCNDGSPAGPKEYILIRKLVQTDHNEGQYLSIPVSSGIDEGEFHCTLKEHYYLKESKGSRRWLVFLEGGWYCISRENCDLRYDTMRRLMSSRGWPATKTASGILSTQPEENPHWWNANMVFIPYCSSDVWSGSSPKSEKSEYAFMGSLIIQEVVKELLGKGLDSAKVLLLAGSSAGGTGVLLNVDLVADQLEELGYPGIQVRGLSDSGWFLDNKQYRRTDCTDIITCAPTEAIQRGIRYWNGVVPERCKQQFKEGEEWNCFFGYKIYPTLRSPVFVVQWLFDEAQLTVDNVHLSGQPVQESQWLYIQNLARELRNTLKDVGASFAAACLSHEVITRSHWTEVQIRGTSLPRALHCWDRSLHDTNKNSKTPLKGCPFHLMDSCPWPQCNPTCPSIRDHFTGQEMSVVQFLMHLGFDVQKMASQQGMEPGKLLGVLSS